jgi:aminoglycoside phosphotransferase (APT) family kinase protein
MTELRDPVGIDPARLDPWLAAHVSNWTAGQPVQWRLLTGGRSNVSYFVTQGERSWVLRRPPLGHVMESAHDMGREHRVLSGLARAGFPAPHPVALCDDVAVIGAPFMLMEYVDARVVADAQDAATLTPAQADLVCANLFETLSRLHQVDAVAAGLGELGRPEGYLERQVRRWTAQWATSRTAPVPAVDALVGWLADRVGAVPSGLPWSIVHGDYRLDNVMLDRDSLGIRAVLDWEMATLGDPVSDLAITLVYWSRPGEELRHRVPVATGVTDGAGFWDRSRIVEAYAAGTGFDLAHLDFCLVLACFKLAVIMESIHARTLLGQQVGAAADGVDMHAACIALAALGREVASGGGVAALSR